MHMLAVDRNQGRFVDVGTYDGHTRGIHALMWHAPTGRVLSTGSSEHAKVSLLEIDCR
jgi:hypothetical protein